LLKDGTVVGWGGNGFGQTNMPCGGDSWTDTDLPTPARFFRPRR